MDIPKMRAKIKCFYAKSFYKRIKMAFLNNFFAKRGYQIAQLLYVGILNP